MSCLVQKDQLAALLLHCQLHICLWTLLHSILAKFVFCWCGSSFLAEDDLFFCGDCTFSHSATIEILPIAGNLLQIWSFNFIAYLSFICTLLCHFLFMCMCVSLLSLLFAVHEFGVEISPIQGCFQTCCHPGKTWLERTLHLEYSTRSSWAELRMLEQFTRLFIMLASVKAGCEACWGIKHEQCLPLFMWFPELKNLVVKSFRQFIRESSSCCVGNWGERGVENTIYRRVENWTRKRRPGTSHSIVQEARAILGSDFGSWISYSSGNKFVSRKRVLDAVEEASDFQLWTRETEGE